MKRHLPDSIASSLDAEERKKLEAYGPDTWAIALARVGGPTQKIVYAPLSKLTTIDMGTPLHCMIIPGKVSPIEEEYLSMFKLPESEDNSSSSSNSENASQ